MVEKIDLNYVENDLTKISLSTDVEVLSNDISLIADENKILEILREEIREQHEEVIDLVTVFVEQEDGIDLYDIKLSFAESDENFLARAYFEENKIEYNLKKMLKPKIRLTAIHEVTHLICQHYINKYMLHTLEFAIITYCISYKNNFKKENFLNSYDIHEDIAYSFLSINMCEFDNLIRCITWNSVRELVEKSKILASDIRKKAVPLKLF